MTRQDRIDAVLDLARRYGAESFITAHPSTVTWLTGLEPAHPAGVSPFALPPVAFAACDGDLAAVLADGQGRDAPSAGVRVVTYPPLAPEADGMLSAARQAVSELVAGRTAATEASTIPAALADLYPWVDVSAEAVRLRARKDPEEIDAIARALALCRVGQQQARAHATPGMTEIELFSEVAAAIERVAGSRVPLHCDLVSGTSTARVGGAPGTRAPADGDLVLCDLAPRRAGYWGDSCTTFAIGEPSAAVQRTHEAVETALRRTIDAIQPGVRAADLDELARHRLNYLHHTGHGIGTSFHEHPRITPDSRDILEPGMVIAIEPAHYEGDHGVRLEQVVVVTSDGCELLSTHDILL